MRVTGQDGASNHRDEFTSKILSVVKPSRRNWGRALKAVQLDGTYAVLVGGAAGLLQSKKLLESPVDGTWKLYNIDELHADLQAATAEDPFGWSCRKNFHDWSAGYFVNRAEHNICSAFDRILTAWIALKVKADLSKDSAEDIWIATWPATRLEVLRGLFVVADRPVPEVVASSLPSFGADRALADTRIAVERLEQLAKQLHDDDPTTECDDPPLSDSDCLALIWARTNAFKHRVKGGSLLHEDRRNALRTEWIASVRAFVFVGVFWSAMLDDVLDKDTPRKKEGEGDAVGCPS